MYVDTYTFPLLHKCPPLLTHLRCPIPSRSRARPPDRRVLLSLHGYTRRMPPARCRVSTARLSTWAIERLLPLPTLAHFSRRFALLSPRSYAAPPVPCAAVTFFHRAEPPDESSLACYRKPPPFTTPLNVQRRANDAFAIIYLNRKLCGASESESAPRVTCLDVVLSSRVEILFLRESQMRAD